MRCHCCGRWRVQLVCSDARGLLRVSYRGRLVAYCRTVDEVARHIDLAMLEEIPATSVSAAPAASSVPTQLKRRAR